jgi:hypothetical protein
MKRSTDMTDATQRQVVRIFEDVLFALPANCASLELRTQPKEKDIEEVALVPTNEKSAEFGVILIGGELYAVFLGVGPFLLLMSALGKLAFADGTGSQSTSQ